MKAISLWQPWASAVAIGAKRIETRGWPTNYRGPLAIHASKRRSKSELFYYSCISPWRGVFYNYKENRPLHDCLPFGAIIAIGELTACRSTDSFTVGEIDIKRFPPDCDMRYQGIAQSLRFTERALGDYSPGRYGLILENIRSIEPIPFKGRQGKLIDVPDELLMEAGIGG